MSNVILRLPEVKKRTGLSRSSIYEKIKQSSFPYQIKLGGEGSRSCGWLESEIDQWITDQVAASRSNQS